MTTETITLPTTLADAQTALLLMADRCNRVQAELDHYVALATTAETEGTPLVFTVLRRLRIAEKHAAQWEKEATERQAECIRLGKQLAELEQQTKEV